MKVLVCGSRQYPDLIGVRERMERLASESQDGDVTVIHGGAQGVDTFADVCAQALGYKRLVIPADWKAWGKAAGPIRNREMLDLEPDLVLAFWDGVSRGTQNTIREAKRRGIPTEVVGSVMCLDNLCSTKETAESA